jgi:hypothetical protein
MIEIEMVQKVKQKVRKREEKGFQQHFQNLVLVQYDLRSLQIL